MPIQFACPQCKTVLTVDDKLAGKSGKCKCGAAIKIPIPAAVAARGATTAGTVATGKAAAVAAKGAPVRAAAPPASSLGNVFNDLTEADFNRQSPYQNVYAPPKINSTEAATLKRFDDGSQATVKPGQLNGLLIFVAILNFIWALAAFALVGILALAADIASKAAESVPLLNAGLGIGIAVLTLLALLFLIGGVGLLLKQKWGWFIAAVNFAYMPVDRIITIVMTLVKGDFALPQLIGGFVGTLLIIGLATAVYGDDTKRIFRIKTAILPAMAALTGVGLALAINGALFALGAFSASP